MLTASKSALASYYSLPVISSQIDSEVKSLMSSALAGGNASFGESSWLTVRTGKVPVDFNPLASHGGSVADWYLAFDGIDYRAAGYMSGQNQITFEYQMVKDYAFDQGFPSPIGTIPVTALDSLNTDGLAQNFVVTGISAPITINSQ